MRILGGLKTGRKQLFIVHQAAYHQLELVCVLDFYVHESVQRQGVGLQLFQVSHACMCSTHHVTRQGISVKSNPPVQPAWLMTYTVS